MDDLTELTLEGASAGIDNYEKLYEPLKDKAKKIPNPIKQIRSQPDQPQMQDQDLDDHYDPPPRSYTDRDRRGSIRDREARGGKDNYEYDLVRRSTDRRGSKGHRDTYVEETYEKRSSRAKSAGRDGNIGGGGGRGLHRDDRRRSMSIPVVSEVC